MSKVSFPVVLLFAFGKSERSVALRTRDFKVWHRGFSTRGDPRTVTLSCCFGGLALVLLSATGCGAKAPTIKHRAGLEPSDTFKLVVSVLQRCGLFKFL